MSHMFRNAEDFNQDLNNWNTSRVTDMVRMFASASDFNGDISGWDVSAVTDMSEMFDGANSFRQNLGKWYIVPADTAYATATNTLNVTTISAQNSALKGHTPNYEIGAGGNSTRFNMTGSTLMFKTATYAGSYTVNVTASGSSVFESGNNWRMLDVTVTGQANTVPILTSIGSKQVSELATLTFTATATDDHGDTLTFSMTGAPTEASIDRNTGAFSWTPSESQDGTHTITVRVEDGNGGSDSEAITVTVDEVNIAPVLASVGSKQVSELATLSFTASASDDDTVGGTANTLTFSMTGAPTEASIDRNTGAFSWTPSESQDGTHTITVRVEDGNGGSDSEAITVTVDEVNVAPVLASVGSKQVSELATLSFTASASDDDTVGGTANTLTFSMTGAPTRMSGC